MLLSWKHITISLCWHNNALSPPVAALVAPATFLQPSLCGIMAVLRPSYDEHILLRPNFALLPDSCRHPDVSLKFRRKDISLLRVHAVSCANVFLYYACSAFIFNFRLNDSWFPSLALPLHAYHYLYHRCFGPTATEMVASKYKTIPQISTHWRMGEKIEKTREKSDLHCTSDLLTWSSTPPNPNTPNNYMIRTYLPSRGFIQMWHVRAIFNAVHIIHVFAFFCPCWALFAVVISLHISFTTTRV